MKTGPTFVIPCNRCQDLADDLDRTGSIDPEITALRDHLRTYMHGFFLICVAPEDFVLCPDGPDIRDYQLGGRNAQTTVIHGDGTYSNQVPS